MTEAFIAFAGMYDSSLPASIHGRDNYGIPQCRLVQPYEGPAAASVSIATVGQGDCLLSENERLREKVILDIC